MYTNYSLDFSKTATLGLCNSTKRFIYFRGSNTPLSGVPVNVGAAAEAICEREHT